MKSKLHICSPQHSLRSVYERIYSEAASEVIGEGMSPQDQRCKSKRVETWGTVSRHLYIQYAIKGRKAFVSQKLSIYSKKLSFSLTPTILQYILQCNVFHSQFKWVAVSMSIKGEYHKITAISFFYFSWFLLFLGNNLGLCKFNTVQGNSRCQIIFSFHYLY